jgi:hypothetical protein
VEGGGFGSRPFSFAGYTESTPMIGRLCLALILAIAPLRAVEPIRVLVFTTTDCPISNRYAPEIQRLATKFKDHAKFVLVYPVPTDSPELILEHQKNSATVSNQFAIPRKHWSRRPASPFHLKSRS